MEVDGGMETGAIGWKGRSIRASLPLKGSWGNKARHGTEDAVAGTFDKAKDQNVSEGCLHVQDLGDPPLHDEKVRIINVQPEPIGRCFGRFVAGHGGY